MAACAEGIAARTDEDDPGSAGAAGASAAGEAGASGTTAGGASGASAGTAGMSTAGAAGKSASGSGGTSGMGTSGAGASGAGTSGAGTSAAGAGAGGAGSAGAGAGGAASGGAGNGGAGSGGAGCGGAGSGGAGAAGAAGASCGPCVSPPANVCLADGGTRRTFTSPGTCGGAGCAYAHTDETCSFGCAGGLCTADPCTAVSCNAPPTPVCSGSSVRTYTAPGTCGGTGACTYPFTDGAACPFGCTNGACNPDPCAGVTCTTPPAPSCFDANTLRTPTGTGTCQPATGACQFASTDQSCPGGCAAGVCKQCATAANCMANEWCSTGPGTCTACGASACGNGLCDCGETVGSCPGDCAPCPTAVKIGDWASGDDGWTYGGLWKRSGGAMVAGSTNSYCNNYTQNLTYNTNVDLSTCASATITFQVKLGDDPSWTPRADKSERLYVQCSGDGGGTWVNLTPTSFPANQSGCSTSYCNGGSNDRSFPLTSQTIALPAACLTTQARFQFQAKGACAWRMQNPGWTVDGVTIN